MDEVENPATAVEILLVDDNPGDVELTKVALRDAKIVNAIHVVRDGAEALAFLRCEGEFVDAPRPDLVLLDLKMPKVDGFQVLAEMKSEPDLRSIPVIVMSSSNAEKDLVRAYDAQVSAYLVKPSNFDEYFNAIRAVKELWFHVVALPPKVRSAAN
ncbi:MAG TPA: response regulator [Bryobacteraceae bacterium]|jgi:chemotaxis family two-component system response regulator Rcp1|nr:response regulator [Bryobacteraceae bacterium]